jgi:hypothetical protein
MERNTIMTMIMQSRSWTIGKGDEGLHIWDIGFLFFLHTMAFEVEKGYMQAGPGIHKAELVIEDGIFDSG